MEHFISNIKKFQELETPPKIPYIPGNRNPIKAFIIWEMKLFSPPQEKFLYFRKQKNRKKIINFSKESFSYISENFFIFQEAETLKNFLCFWK